MFTKNLWSGQSTWEWMLCLRRWKNGWGGKGPTIPHHPLDPEFSDLGHQLVKSSESAPLWFDLKSLIPSSLPNSPLRATQLKNWCDCYLWTRWCLHDLYWGQIILIDSRQTRAEESRGAGSPKKIEDPRRGIGQHRQVLLQTPRRKIYVLNIIVIRA